MKKASCLFLIVLLMVSLVHFAYADTYDGEAVVERALEELGKPYEWGAVGPRSYDNSGLVSYCITGIHARIGTTTTFMTWPRVDDPQPGDICVKSDHCGIYIGGGSMIHAPTFGAVVSRGPVQSGMIIVRPVMPLNPQELPDLPTTGDSVPVIPLALCMAVSFGIFLLLMRRKKA